MTEQNTGANALPSPECHPDTQMPVQDFIHAYFRRLGLPVPQAEPVCTGALLNTLQYAHVTRIPYENLDILSGKALPMDAAGQFKKTIQARRGGYCFELNGIYACLLNALGYQVTTYMGRYLRGETAVPMRRHRVIRAACSDGAFICDAGVGQQAPRHPLAFIPNFVQEQFSETYRIRREPFFGWVIDDRHQGDWRPFYSFTEEEQLDIDFVMPNYYCEHSADSVFNKKMMLSIKTPDGRKTIDGNLFRAFARDSVEEMTIATPEQLIELLDQVFNLDPPTAAQAAFYLAAGSSVRK